MAIQAVLFDAVGTLIEAWPPVAQVYREAGRRFGSRHSLAEIERRFRVSFARHQQAGRTDEDFERRRWRAIVAEVLDDVTDGADELFELLWAHFAESAHWRVFDDVPAVWAALEDRGLHLGLASNFDARLLSICRDLEPLRRCRSVFCSSQIGYCKPRVEFFRAIEEALDLAPRQLLLVGDDLEADVHGARRAGWNAIHVDRCAQGDGRDLHRALGGLERLPSPPDSIG